MWKLRSDLSTGDIFGHMLLWVLLGVVTCGIALFLFPYSMGSLVINATTLHDEQGRPLGRLRCTRGTGNNIGHALLWWFFSVVTLGIAGFFYAYRVASDLLNDTVVDPAR